MCKRHVARAAGLLLLVALDLSPCAAFAQVEFDLLWSHDTGG
jgi:hypothetical protein